MSKSMDWSQVSGKILSVDGFNQGSERVVITTDKGVLVFDADVQCCDMTYLADLEGDASSLVGSELCVAKYLKSEDSTDSEEVDRGAEYHFYEIQTHAGDLWMRWYGDSGDTGCYSNKVDVSWTPSESLVASQTVSVSPRAPLVLGMVQAATRADSHMDYDAAVNAYLVSRGVTKCQVRDFWPSNACTSVVLVSHPDLLEEGVAEFYAMLYAS